MSEKVPAEISVQLSQALNVIGRHLESTLLAVHLYGSALDGGLKPYSDIDLLVAVAAPLNDAVRQALLVDLLEVSASPGQNRFFADSCGNPVKFSNQRSSEKGAIDARYY